MHGRLVSTPRCQQAYGRSYRHTGQVNQALPVPSIHEPLLNWCKTIDSSLNGLLLNWYDGALNHYIANSNVSTDSAPTCCPIDSLCAARALHFGGNRCQFLATINTDLRQLIMSWIDSPMHARESIVSLSRRKWVGSRVAQADRRRFRKSTSNRPQAPVIESAQSTIPFYLICQTNPDGMTSRFGIPNGILSRKSRSRINQGSNSAPGIFRPE